MMDMTHMPLTPARIKNQVNILRRDMEKLGQSISQSQALETLSHMHGHKDWNTFKAAIDKVANTPPAFIPGDSVSGTYLGQAYTGKVHSVERHKKPGFQRIAIDFDTPVDVVTFDSFSAFRRRVKGVINPDGRTLETTSNGDPHLVVKAA